MADSKVWFITGCSKGFGRIWAEAALERGDKVAARDASTLAPLAETYGDDVLAPALDVQDMEADRAAVQQAHEKFGRLEHTGSADGHTLALAFAVFLAIRGLPRTHRGGWRGR